MSCSIKYYIHIIYLSHKFSLLFILVGVAVLLLFVDVAQSQDCSIPYSPKIPHGSRTKCEIIDNKEYSTYECDNGYEFSSKRANRTYETLNGVLYGVILSCNASGCKKADMPIKEKKNLYEANNVEYLEGHCTQAALPDHCVPEKSFVDYACKAGFELDDQYGFLHAKCLNSYMWDSAPKCVPAEQKKKDEDDEEGDGEDEEDQTSTTVTSKKSQAGLTTTIKKAPPRLKDEEDDDQEEQDEEDDVSIATTTMKKTSPTATTIRNLNLPPAASIDVTTKEVDASNDQSDRTQTSTNLDQTFNFNDTLVNSTTQIGLMTTTSVIMVENPTIGEFNETLNQTDSTGTTTQTISTTSDNNSTNETTKEMISLISSSPSSFDSTNSIAETTTGFLNGCSSYFPRPNFYNPENVILNLTRHSVIKDFFEVNSSITYSCSFGYFFYNTTDGLSLKTVCLSNGSWSNIGNCQPPLCWDKLPWRPLNGRRETKLMLTAITGYTNGSHVNFTCNKYFDRIGPSSVYCREGKWPQNTTECRLTNKLCRKRPQAVIKNGYLLTLTRYDLKNETDFEKFETITVFPLASYACEDDYAFDFPKKLESKLINKKMVYYQTIECIDEEKWEEIPNCIKTPQKRSM